MKNQNKKAVKALAVSMFAVGFVTPLMFSNIAEAANFGKGGTGQWLSNDVLDKTSTTSTTAATSQWATQTGTDAANYVVFHGVKFKIVAVDDVSKGQNAKVTLWSYDTSLSTSAYNSDGSWGSNVNKAYANSGLKTAMDNLYSTTFASDSRIQEVTLAGETISSTSIAYQEKDTTDTIKSYVWAPSYTEVMNAGTWGFSSDNTTAKSQRAVGDYSWLRSPYPAYGNYAYYVYDYGYVSHYHVDYDILLRPALQILNQTSCVFTTNVTIPTNGVFTANGSGTATNYALNSTATIVPTFTPATDGVTLDGTKIGIKTTDKSSGTYAMAGLLTEEADSAKNDTWANLNGPTATSTKGISYMAQVSSNELDLSGVTAGTDYTLKVFGLKTADTTVTELASGAITGLSNGADGKIHMVVSGSVNAGVPVTVSNGAVVDFGGGDLTAKLDLKTGGNLAVNGQLNFDANGVVKQTADSAILAPITVIKPNANDAGKALFKDVANKNQLDVKDGNLIIVGQVTDGQYYVLVAGDAVANEDLTSADLWKKENIVLDLSKYTAGGYLLVDYNYVTGDDSIALKVQAATAEEANTSGLAAVQQGALAVSKEFTGDVENHLGMIANPKLAEKDKYGKEIWASYIRTKETTEGMKLGAGIEGNNTAQYNGAVVGVDFYSSKKSIAGMAFSYITGDVDSYSGTTATKNDAKYYGVSFYDRVTNGNTALIYDIGYIRGNNDVSQYYNGKSMTSDVKTNTYTAGARWETAIETGKSRVVPFAAFRYMRVNNGDYTNSHNTRFEIKNQNLYIPKVGIAWTGDFAMPQSAWTWRPSVEVGYIWNLGDRSANSNVLVGTKIADIGYDVADKSSYYAKAGMEFKCKNFTAGLSYRYLKGDAVRNNKWNVNVSWAF